jgi:hypothetical protein
MSYDNLTEQQRRALGLGELLLQAKDPKAQMEWKRLVKRINPNVQLPELELEDKIEAVGKRQQEWEEKQEARHTEDRTKRRHDAEAKAAEAAGFKVEDIRKLAVDEGIGTFEAALKFATMARETAEPSADNYGGPMGRGPANIVPPDWRKMTPAERVRNGQRIFHEGITDLMRRQRAGR